jgi:hypothetical protein
VAVEQPGARAVRDHVCGRGLAADQLDVVQCMALLVEDVAVPASETMRFDSGCQKQGVKQPWDWICHELRQCHKYFPHVVYITAVHIIPAMGVHLQTVARLKVRHMGTLLHQPGVPRRQAGQADHPRASINSRPGFYEQRIDLDL